MAKGFTKDGKFRPTGNNSRKSSRKKSIETSGAKLKKCEVRLTDSHTGEKLILEKGDCVNFKEGSDVITRVNGVQHYGKIVKGGTDKFYMVKYHKNLTAQVPRSKVFGFRKVT